MTFTGPPRAIEDVLTSDRFASLMRDTELATGATAAGPGVDAVSSGVTGPRFGRFTDPAAQARYDRLRELEKLRRKQQQSLGE